MDGSGQSKKGYYRDADGNWQVDRRSGPDRRSGRPSAAWTHERRCLYRRQADRELYEKDHKRMIEEALSDFAQEHDGRL